VIRRRLQLPCPTKYGNKEAANDYVRLMEFTWLRDNKTALTEAHGGDFARRFVHASRANCWGRHAVVSGLHFRYLGDGRLHGRGRSRTRRGPISRSWPPIFSRTGASFSRRLAEKPADGAAEQLCPLS
jgi:hypothetical protein